MEIQKVSGKTFQNQWECQRYVTDIFLCYETMLENTCICKHSNIQRKKTHLHKHTKMPIHRGAFGKQSQQQAFINPTDLTISVANRSMAGDQQKVKPGSRSTRIENSNNKVCISGMLCCLWKLNNVGFSSKNATITFL